MISYGDRKQPFSWKPWRRWLKVAFLAWVIVIVIGAVKFAYAGDVTVSWTNATQNEDGTDIPVPPATAATSLVSTTLKWGACNPDDTPALPLLEATFPTTVPGNSETQTVFIFTPGRWCFIGVHTNAGDPANNIDPQTSADSNPAFKMVIMVPEPPQNLMVVEPDLIVWDILKEDDEYKFLGVGQVPGGTPCDSSQRVNGRYVVPNDLVQWFGNVRPPVVVADCS